MVVSANELVWIGAFLSLNTVVRTTRGRGADDAGPLFFSSLFGAHVYSCSHYDNDGEKEPLSWSDIEKMIPRPQF